MKPLSKDLRNKFENTIVNARTIAEEAAKIALEQLGVEKSTPYTFLSEDQRELRRKLRAHGRQLGDIRYSKTEMQEIERLVEEVAYEYWHRMLFARFLAENNLLMYYEYDDIENAVSISLSECEEMASEMNCINGWELAAKLATKMLPQVFRPESPVFEIQFAPEQQKKLENLLSELDTEVFTASDSLGWAYQFWQNKKKKAVNNSQVKIGARELPAVTQLFTEPYMVSYLLDNTLGAWWAKQRLSQYDFQYAISERELRKKASIQNVNLKYLRFVKKECDIWSLVGAEFDGWPKKLSEFKLLDPCCGSGHFLVAAFLMIVPMRMCLEGLSAKDACDAVLRENIHGLEIDKRCVELAAFALALTAWKYPGSGGFRMLPELQIAWCGQSVNVRKDEWLSLAEDNSDLKIHLLGLYNLFKDAPILGSLLNPKHLFEVGSLFENEWDTVSKLLKDKLDKNQNEDDGIGIVAHGIEKAFQLLGDNYHLVITNVPYLKRGKQNIILQKYCDKYYEYGKDELATVFVQRCMELLKPKGKLSVVMPQFWTFHRRSMNLRLDLLKNTHIESVTILGTNAFDAISGEIVNIGLYKFEKSISAENFTFGIDVTEFKTPIEKASALRTVDLSFRVQKNFFNNVDARIVFSINSDKSLLSKYGISAGGLQTFDKPRFIQKHWENYNIKNGWINLQSTVNKTTLYSGRENILLWECGNGELYKNVLAMEASGYKSGVWRAGTQVWGKRGVLFKLMGEKLEATLYTGQAFENTTGVIIPKSDNYLLPIWCYCSSSEFSEEIRKIDKKIAVTNGNLVKVPIDIAYWRKVAEEKYPKGLPKPYSADPTQWIFHGYPQNSIEPLQVAVARLLGYRWPAELDKDIELSDEAKSLVARCDELLSYSDTDGIVCIPSVRGEASASEKLLNLLAEAYKGQDINAKVSELLASSDYAGKSLDSWLRDKFFTQHNKLFGHRPFIWHIWDGLKDGFSVLVNYHKLDRKNLETLIYTYLGDWINKQKAESASGIDGAEEKFVAAMSLKKSLEFILEGEAPYDIFIRWKPIYKQPIGWEPDINDGVRMNIRPFMSVTDVGKKDAGVLRDKPNIKWEKDRGKDTENSPWYEVFDCDRINDFHLKLEAKQKAKQEMR